MSISWCVLGVVYWISLLFSIVKVTHTHAYKHILQGLVWITQSLEGHQWWIVFMQSHTIQPASWLGLCSWETIHRHVDPWSWKLKTSLTQTSGVRFRLDLKLSEAAAVAGLAKCWCSSRECKLHLWKYHIYF